MAIERCGAKTNQQGQELKKHGTPLFPVACYADGAAEEPIHWHWHDELEAVVVEAGTAVVCVDGAQHAITRGQGVFINAGALHSVKTRENGGCQTHSVVFHPRLVGGGIDSIFWQGYLQPLLSDAACRCIRLDSAALWEREALAAVRDAWQACVSEQAGFEFETRAALSRLIFLLTSHRPPAPKGLPKKALRDGERIKAMLHYIQAHDSEELTAAEIAGSAMVSESECLRCFRSVIGATPIQYVKQMRIQKAAELLAHTDQKIADIGALCGFQEMSYFAKSFREAKGCTPSAYRGGKSK